MGRGVIGRTGSRVQGRVELERSNACVCAPNRAQLSAGETVLVPVVKPDLAKEYHAQVRINF